GGRAGRPGRTREGDGGVLPGRARARRLRHDPGARRPQHDVGPRVQGRARRPRAGRVARRHPRRPRRAEDRRLPGEPQPSALDRRPGDPDSRARDRGERRALHPRRHRRPGRQGAALLPDGARPAAGRGAAADRARLLRGRPRADRVGPGPRAAGRRARVAHSLAHRHPWPGPRRPGPNAIGGQPPGCHYTDRMAVEAHTPLDAARVKLDFPILARPVYGKQLVYLDSANSSQKPRAVIDRIVEVYETGYANVHRGVYHLGVVATDALEGARDKVAAFLNAPSRREIVFTRQATEALNLVAYAYG